MALWDESTYRGGQRERPDPFSRDDGRHVHELTPAAELLHGEETVVYADAAYQ